MVSPKVFGFKTDYQCKKIRAEEKKRSELLHFNNWLFLTVFFLSLTFTVLLLRVKKLIRQRNLNYIKNYITTLRFSDLEYKNTIIMTYY